MDFNDSCFGSKPRWHQARRQRNAAARGAQEANNTFWPTDLGVLMGPMGPQVGFRWRPSPPFGVAKRLQNPMDVYEFAAWKQVKVAPSNKADKKSSKGTVECSCSIGAPPGELRTTRLPRGQLRFPCSRGWGPTRPITISGSRAFGRLWAQ